MCKMKRPPTHRPKVGPGGTFEEFADHPGPPADSERIDRREEFSLELGGLNPLEFGFDGVFVDGPGDEGGVLVGAVCFHAGGRTSQTCDDYLAIPESIFKHYFSSRKRETEFMHQRSSVGTS